MPLQPAVNNPAISRCTSAPCLFPDVKITGALVNGGNNAEINLGDIFASATPSTKMEAYSDLALKACDNFVSAGDAEKIVNGLNAPDIHHRSNYGFLVDQAINLSELSKKFEGNDDSLEEAKEKLTSLMLLYLEDPRQNISARLVGKDKLYKVGKNLSEFVDRVLKEHKNVFRDVALSLHHDYLRDGLVKSLCNRHGGLPDLQSATDSSINGNASHSAKFHLTEQLLKNITQNDGKSLAEFFRNMLSQLDLHKPADSARPRKSVQVVHPQRAGAQDDVGNAHPAGSVIRSGDVSVKFDGFAPVSSSDAGVLRRTNSDEVYLAQNRLIERLVIELVTAHNRELIRIDEQQRRFDDLRVGDTRRGSDDDQVIRLPLIVGSESSYEAEQSSDQVVDERAVRAQDGVSEIEGPSPPPLPPPLPHPAVPEVPRYGGRILLPGLNSAGEGEAAQSGREPPRLLRAVSSQAPIRLKTNAASGVSEFMAVHKKISRNWSQVLDSNESTSRRGSSDFGVEARPAINRTASVSSISSDSSAQTDLSDTSRTRAPSDTPVSPTRASSDKSKPLPPRYKIVMTNLPPPQLQVFTSVSEKKEYFKALSSVLQGNTKAELALREHIQKGEDPSQDTGIIREYYDSVVNQFPAFVQIKRLFAQDETKNVMAGVVKAPVNRAIDRNAGQAASPIDSITVSQAPELVDESRNATR